MTEHRHLTTKRDDGPGREAGYARYDRRQVEDDLIGTLRGEHLLEDELQAVTNSLKHATSPRRVHDRADAVLHLGQHTALEPHVEDGPGQQDHEEDDDLDDDEPHRVDGGLEGTHATPASREVSVSTALSETTVPGASGTVVRL